jgi:hypothetical protein
MGSIEIIGVAALAVVGVGWLVVSFSSPGQRRALVEWISATALYLALCMLFLHLTLRTRADGGALAPWAFGFLCAVFASGVVVSLVNAVRATRSADKSQASTTN